MGTLCSSPDSDYDEDSERVYIRRSYAEPVIEVEIGVTTEE